MTHTTMQKTAIHLQRGKPPKLRTPGLHSIFDTSASFGAAKRADTSVDLPSPRRASATARRLDAAAIHLPRSHKGPPLPRSYSVRTGDYAGHELAPYTGRPGAMDAFDKPSRMGNSLFYRDGSVEQVG